jgi:RNA ligase
MNYKFPVIKNIQQVKQAITGCEEFIVAERDFYDVVNYVVQKSDTFQKVETENDAIKRECRGLIFDKQGNLISRPFHKFFNFGEKVYDGEPDISKPHVILKKLDGSMIRPVEVENGTFEYKGKTFSLFTKMGNTDVSKQAEKFIKGKEGYFKLIVACLKNGSTPIFEWTAPYNRIVINYEKEQLTLLAIRFNENGKYLKMDDVKKVVGKLNIPVVESYPGNISSVRQFLGDIKENEEEGFVIRFDDGHMVKVKTEWYVAKHKAKDKMLFEKDVISMIVNETVDDIKPMLTELDLNKIEEFEDQFWGGVWGKSRFFKEEFKKIDNSDRKKAAKQIGEYPKEYQVIFFGMIDGREPIETMKYIMKRNCSSQSRVEEIRWMFDCSWNNIDQE